MITVDSRLFEVDGTKVIRIIENYDNTEYRQHNNTVTCTVNCIDSDNPEIRINGVGIIGSLQYAEVSSRRLESEINK
jgi:ribosomal protein S8E